MKKRRFMKQLACILAVIMALSSPLITFAQGTAMQNTNVPQSEEVVIDEVVGGGRE